MRAEASTLERMVPGLGLVNRLASSRIGPTFSDQTFFKTVRQLASLGLSGLNDPYEKHAWVHACMHVRALAIASLPFRIYTGTVDSPEPADDAEGRQLQDVFDAPNPLLSSAQLWEAASLYLDGQGGNYFFLESGLDRPRRVTDVPREIFPIGQDQIQVVKGKGGFPLGYVYAAGTGSQIPLEPEQVASVKFFNPKNPLIGLSPLSAVRDAVGTDYRASRYSKAVFDNYGDVGGILSTEQPIDDQKYQQLRSWWHDTHEGAHNSKRTAILDSGLKYTPTTIAQKDMEFLEQRRWSREEIIAVFMLHKLDLGLLESVNYATSLVASRMSWEKAHLPRIAMIQDSLWMNLFRHLHGGKYWGSFDVSGVEAFQAGYYDRVLSARQLAAMGFPPNRINERMNLGLPPFDGGDNPTIPYNLLPVGSTSVLVQKEDQPVALSIGAYKEKSNAQAWRRTKVGRLTDGADGSMILVPHAVRSRHPARKITASVPPMPKTRAVRATVEDPGWDHWVRAVLQPGETLMLRLLKRELRKIRAEVLKAVAENVTDSGRSVRGPADEAKKILPGSQAWKDNIWNGLRPAFESQLVAAAEDAAGQLGVAFDSGAFDPLIPSYLDIRENLVKDATETLWTNLKDTIQEGLGVNETTAQIQERVMEEMAGYLDGGAPRALTIARTETASASNWARNEVYTKEGVEQQQWLTARDEHVRPSHQALQGKVVEVGKKFSDGDGNELYYPSDPLAPVETVVNCRCRVAPWFKGMPKTGEA